MSNRAVASHPESLAAKIDPLSAVVHAELAGMRTLLEKALSATPGRQWLTIEKAAALAGRTPQCIRGWCGTESIGTMVRGKWQVDKAGLRRVLLDRLDGDETRLPAGLR